MNNLSYRDALQITEQVVADAPKDFRYEEHPGPISCLYVHEGKPDCIVGNVLVRMGVQPEVFAQYEGIGAHSLLEWLKKDGVIDGYDTKTADFLGCIQRRQDDGNTWVESLEDAKKYMDRIRSH